MTPSSARHTDRQARARPAFSIETAPSERVPNDAPKRRRIEKKSSTETLGCASKPVEFSKALNEGSQSAKSDKRVKGRRGLLKFITQVPLDILHEVFSELEPLDLLRLSWSSKNLNLIIMEKNARYLWEEAFERLYKSEKSPPRCPDGLNLAQYTKFLFQKDCMLCGSIYGYHASWPLRLRACLKCISESGRFHVTDSDMNYCPWVLKISARKQEFCLIEDWVEYTGAHCSPERREEMLERVCLMEKYANQFKDWEASRHQDRQASLEQIRSQRQAQILLKLAELGWPKPRVEEITHNLISYKLPGFGKSKKLSDREWNELRPELLEHLEKLEIIYLDEKIEEKLRERWLSFKIQFEEWYRTQNGDLYWKPCVVDIAIVDPFESMIFESSIEGFMFSIHEIDRVARNWMYSRSEFLISLLPEDVRGSVVTEFTNGNPVMRLLPHLACLLFRKPEGYCSSATVADICTLSDICSHRVSFERNSQMEGNEIRHRIRSLYGLRPWYWDSQTLEFNYKAYIIARNVLQHVLGLDPLKTTLADIGKSRLRFRCTQCPRYSSCFGTLKDWLGIIDHEMYYEGNISMTLRWKTWTIIP